MGREKGWRANFATRQGSVQKTLFFFKSRHFRAPATDSSEYGNVCKQIRSEKRQRMEGTLVHNRRAGGREGKALRLFC